MYRLQLVAVESVPIESPQVRAEITSRCALRSRLLSTRLLLRCAAYQSPCQHISLLPYHSSVCNVAGD
jgi:hypothetical protein